MDKKMKRYTIDDNKTIRCANCGSKDFNAKLTVEVDASFYTYDKNLIPYDKSLISDVEIAEFDEDEIEDVECSNCGLTIADSYYSFKKEVEKNKEQKMNKLYEQIIIENLKKDIKKQKE